MNNFRIFLILSFFLIANKIFSQKNFIEATMISQKNDTIKGLIDFQDWSYEPENISFKRSIREKEEVFYPYDIKGFIVNNELYESHRVKIYDNMQLTFPESPVIGTEKVVEKTIFLRCLIKGYCNLYSFTNPRGKPFLYISKSNDELMALINRETALQRKNGYILGTDDKFRPQLAAVLADYPESTEKIRIVNYGIKSIQKIILNYNQHFADKKPITYLSVQKKNKFDISLLAGGNHSFLKLASNPTFLSTKRVPDQTIKGYGLDFGISFQYFIRRRFNKFSVVNDLVFKTMYLSNSVSDGDATIQTDFNNSYLRLYSQGRYQFLKNKNFSLSFNAGAVFSHSLKKDNSYTRVTSTKTTSGLLFPANDFKQFNVGIVGGLKCQFNKAFSLELRGERNKGMSHYLNVSTGLSSLNLLFSYAFTEGGGNK